MDLYSYVVVRDYGFAPNPFHGVCTLATCKPEIRATATPGDWVVGIGSVQENLGGRLIYAMEVAEAISFDEYWSDPRFHSKRPYLPGSKKMRYGDNIYHHGRGDQWVQEDSHHSLAGGISNPLNLNRDTSTDRVLIGLKYYYFGSDCPEVPAQFEDISRSRRGHKCNFPDKLVSDFLDWLQGTYQPGCHGLPVNW